MAGLDIPSGEGLLEAQQQDAAQIPYKNIALADEGIKGFMNAFQMQQQIGNKRRALEQQLQIAYMKNDLDQEKFGITMDNMQTRHAIELARLQQTAQHQGDMVDIAQKSLELRNSAFELTKQKYTDAFEGQQGVQDAEASLSADGISPGDPRYWPEYTRRMAEVGGKAPASVLNKSASIAATNHNHAIDQLERAQKARETAFAEEVGRRVYGNPKAQDFNPILHPEQYQDETTKTSFSDWYYGKKPQPTGNKTISLKNAEGKVVGSRSVSSQDLTELNKTYQQIQAERNAIPSRVNVPSLGVYGGDVMVKDSSGKTWRTTSDKISEMKKRDPGIVIVP